MIQKVKNYIKKVKQRKIQRIELKKYKEYYRAVQCGQAYLEYIKNDLEQQKKKNMNRAQRRRFEKSLEKAILTPEIVQFYKNKIDNTLKYIEMQLNPPKKSKLKFDKSGTKSVKVGK